MALFRMVDGKRVQMTDDEEAAVRAEWAATSQRTLTKAEQLQAYYGKHPELLALIDEIAESRSLTRAQVMARLAGKLP